MYCVLFVYSFLFIGFVNSGLLDDLRERVNRDARRGKPPHKHSCEVDGRWYKHNEMLKTDDPCESCQCRFGMVSCMSVMCDFPQCVDRDMTPDVCCQTCPNGRNCWLDGEIVSGDMVHMDEYGGCTRICHCPVDTRAYWTHGENTKAVCDVSCGPAMDEEESYEVGPEVGKGQMEEVLPLTELFNQNG